MRKQRAFAPLTEEEYEQVGEWVCQGTYEAVRDRVNKPRPEGFGLNISIRPLQTLHAKKNKIISINKRLEQSPKLTLTQFDAIAAGEVADVSDEVHDAIMDTTLDLATSGDNSPTDLLALQRLADFPERAALRAAREQRDIEKHAHKMDMDAHRKHMDEEYLTLSREANELRKRAHDLRERELALKGSAAVSAATVGVPPTTPATHDHLGPLASTLEQVNERTRALFNLPQKPYEPEGASLPDSEPTASPDAPESRRRGDETLESNPQQTQTSEPSAVNNPPSPCLSEHSVTTTPSPTLPTPSAKPQPSAPPHEPSSSSPSTVPLVVNQPSVPKPPTLQERVNAYTLARHYEASEGRDARKVGRNASRNFTTKLHRCPCGNEVPCPEHGDFPPTFWSAFPDSYDYFHPLRLRNLPYTAPNIILLEQERDAGLAKWDALMADPAQLAIINDRVREHAIGRWRCNTPRPPRTPFPDETWTQQCPCGGEPFCEYHQKLYFEVRYIRPWDPDYVAALKRNRIPVYTPTEAEIGFPNPHAAPPQQPPK